MDIFGVINGGSSSGTTRGATGPRGFQGVVGTTGTQGFQGIAGPNNVLEVVTNEINELNDGSGVLIDGALLKDNVLTCSSCVINSADFTTSASFNTGECSITRHGTGLLLANQTASESLKIDGYTVLPWAEGGGLGASSKRFADNYFGTVDCSGVTNTGDLTQTGDILFSDNITSNIGSNLNRANTLYAAQVDSTVSTFGTITTDSLTERTTDNGIDVENVHHQDGDVSGLIFRANTSLNTPAIKTADGTTSMVTKSTGIGTASIWDAAGDSEAIRIDGSGSISLFGQIDASSNGIKNISDPIDDQDACTKKFMQQKSTDRFAFWRANVAASGDVSLGGGAAPLAMCRASGHITDVQLIADDEFHDYFGSGESCYVRLSVSHGALNTVQFDFADMTFRADANGICDGGSGRAYGQKTTSISVSAGDSVDALIDLNSTGTGSCEVNVIVYVEYD